MADTRTRYYEFSLDEKSKVIVETEEPVARGGSAVAAKGQLVEDTRKTFAETVAKIPAIINPIREQIAKSVSSADSVQIEFGLKLSGEFGIIVAKSQAEANFKISFVWKGADAGAA